jgi:hypothetical protein
MTNPSVDIKLPFAIASVFKVFKNLSACEGDRGTASQVVQDLRRSNKLN